MKKIFLSLLLVCHFHPLLAGLARSEALGGSYVAHHYFYDSSNVFLNPSYLNLGSNFFIMEWGDDIDLAENDSGRRPEGGIFKTIGPLHTGLYLGHDGPSASRKEITIDNANRNLLYPNNSAEIFIAGDVGPKWGISFKASHNTDRPIGTAQKEQNTLEVKFGILDSPYEIFLNFTPIDTSKGGETSSAKFEGHLATTLGASYTFYDYIFHATLKKNGYDYYREHDGLLEQRKTYFEWTLGSGSTLWLTEEAKIYIDMYLFTSKSTTHERISNANVAYETNLWKVPVTIGLEAYVKEWLTLRGNISQNLYSEQNSSAYKHRSVKDSTSVIMGATFHLGNFKIDGLVGTVDALGNERKTGQFNLSTLMTKVSASYSF